MRMKIVALICLMFLGTSTPLSADPIVNLVDGIFATGIEDLQIGASFYDVRFVEGTYFDIYPSPTAPTPFSDFASAAQAAASIAHTLTFSPAIDFLRFSAVSRNLHVAYGIPTGAPGALPSVDPDLHGLFSLDFGGPDATSVLLWPVFAPSAPHEVPEPGSLLLLSLGLVGFGIMRRRV